MFYHNKSFIFYWKKFCLFSYQTPGKNISILFKTPLGKSNFQMQKKVVWKSPLFNLSEKELIFWERIDYPYNQTLPENRFCWFLRDPEIHKWVILVMSCWPNNNRKDNSELFWWLRYDDPCEETFYFFEEIFSQDIQFGVYHPSFFSKLPTYKGKIKTEIHQIWIIHPLQYEKDLQKIKTAFPDISYSNFDTFSNLANYLIIRPQNFLVAHEKNNIEKPSNELNFLSSIGVTEYKNSLTSSEYIIEVQNQIFHFCWENEKKSTYYNINNFSLLQICQQNLSWLYSFPNNIKHFSKIYKGKEAFFFHVIESLLKENKISISDAAESIELYKNNSFF